MKTLISTLACCLMLSVFVQAHGGPKTATSSLKVVETSTSIRLANVVGVYQYAGKKAAVNFNLKEGDKLTISILGNDGSTIYHHVPKQHHVNHIMELSQFPNGDYIIKATLNGRSIRKEISLPAAQ